MLVLVPALSDAAEFRSYLLGPPPCTGLISAPTPPALPLNGAQGYLSNLPFSWAKFCGEPVSAWAAAAGTYRGDVGRFGIANEGHFSFTCCSSGTTSAGINVNLGAAIGQVRDRVTVTGGSGSGTLRLTIVYGGSASFSSRVTQVNAQARADFIAGAESFTVFQGTPGTLIADFPFTFGVPIEFGWGIESEFRLLNAPFFAGDGAQARFNYSASLVATEVLGIPGAQVISDSGVAYPTGGPGPAIQVIDTSALESTGRVTFDVLLSPPTATDIMVDYATASGDALEGADYTARAGTLTFSPGVTAASVTVPLVQDTIGEPDERFFLNLSNPRGAMLSDSRAVATILDGNASPELRINDVATVEGNSGTHDVTFTVTLTPPTSSAVSVDFQTVSGSATAETDFLPISGTLTFSPGQTSQTIDVRVSGDIVPEPSETFMVTLGGAVSAVVVGGGLGTATITNDDQATLEVLDPGCSGATLCDGRHPSLLVERTTCGQTAFLTSELAKLRGASVERNAVAADGVTLLMLRMRSSVPVSFALRKADGTSPIGEEMGSLMDRNGCSRGREVTVDPELAVDADYVFAVYQAPNAYPVGSDSVVLAALPEGGAEIQQSLGLERVPVVLVHGLWSGPDAWRRVSQAPARWTERLQNAGFGADEDCLVDYSLTAAGTFDPVEPSVPIDALISMTRCAKNKLRAGRNTAVTQVDVVGHSMGGLVARARVKYGRYPYLGAWNLQKGEFHRVVTIGTPHRGTPFADLLVSHQCDVSLFGSLREVMATTGLPIGPAVFGLQTSSDPLAHIGTTAVPAHSIVGVAPNTSLLETFLDGLMFMFGLSTNVDRLLGGNGGHDCIVPTTSQRGGHSGAVLSTVGGLNHLDETVSTRVVEDVVTTLGLSTTPGAFAGYPVSTPVGAYIAPYLCPPSVRAEAPLAGTLNLTPTPGEVYRPGEAVVVRATPTGGLPEGLLISFGGELEGITGPGPYSRTYIAPAARVGRLEIVAYTYGGTEAYSGKTYIDVLPSDSPTVLTVAPTQLSLAVRGETAQVRVSGRYDHGEVLDLTSASAGTKYATSNDAVATVTAEGVVEARGDGSVSILVSNAGRNTSVGVSVAITNAPPTLSAPGAVSLLPGEGLDVPVGASDPDGDLLRISGVDLPPFATVIDYGGGTGVVQLRPTHTDIGVHRLLISLADGGTPSLGDTKAISVMVGSTSGYYTVTPCRIVDTRSTGGPALAAGTRRIWPVVGRCGIPSTATAVSFNITVTGASGDGHLRVYPGDGSLPQSSDLNFSVGQTRANNVISTLGNSASVAIYSGQSIGSVHVILDVTGYFQ